MKEIIRNKKILTLAELKTMAKPVFVRFDVKKANLFGSYARGEATGKSDVDVVVEFVGQKSLFDLVGLRNSLQKVLRHKVDVGTPASIHPAMKESIENDFIALL